MACRLYALTPVSLQYTRALCCEWLTDYYLIHRRDAERCQRQVVNGLQIATTYTHPLHRSRPAGVVNGLQITIINNVRQYPARLRGVVNGLQITIINNILGRHKPRAAVVNGLQITTTNTKWFINMSM